MKMKLLAIILSMLAGAAVWAEPVSSVRAVKGEAFAVRNFKRIPLKAGLALETGDHVFTAEGASAELAGEDGAGLGAGNYVGLGGGGHMKLLSAASDPAGAGLLLIEGGLRLVVTNAPKDGFKIRTPVAILAIPAGTDLVCRHTPPVGGLLKSGRGETSVAVIRGERQTFLFSPAHAREGRSPPWESSIESRKQALIRGGDEPIEFRVLTKEEIQGLKALFPVSSASGQADEGAGDGTTESSAQAGPDSGVNASKIMDENVERMREQALEQIEENITQEIKNVRISEPPPLPPSNPSAP